MSRPGLTGERLAAMFILAAVLFNPPVLSIFNRAEQLFGVPLLYLYLFLAWALLITLTALLVERAEEGSEPVKPQQNPGCPDDAQGTDA
jgi:hypothetical protein